MSLESRFRSLEREVRKTMEAQGRLSRARAALHDSPAPNGGRKDVTFRMRTTQAERALMDAAAASLELSTSEFVRWAALEAAAAALKEK